MRSVAPGATHSYRTDYEEMPYHMANQPSEMGRRIPTVDETLAQMHLQGRSMGGSNDLHTFIRSVSCLCSH
jgi:hypothetical protein